MIVHGHSRTVDFRRLPSRAPSAYTCPKTRRRNKGFGSSRENCNSPSFLLRGPSTFMTGFSALVAARSVTATFLLASATSVACPANSRRHDCDEGMESGESASGFPVTVGILSEWVIASLEGRGCLESRSCFEVQVVGGVDARWVDGDFLRATVASDTAAAELASGLYPRALPLETVKGVSRKPIKLSDACVRVIVPPCQ
jgi:hypothetical protein